MAKFKKLCKAYEEFLGEVGKICQIPEDHWIDSIDISDKVCKVRHTDGEGDTCFKEINIKKGELTESSVQSLERWQKRLIKNA